MFCRKCGKELPNNVNFCRYCGTRLYMPVQSHYTQIHTKEVPLDNKLHKKHMAKGNLRLAMIAIMCLILMIGGYQLFLTDDIRNKAEQVVYLEMYDKRNNIIGSASGFFIENGSTLVTNYHVIDGTHAITATTFDGNKSTTATTVLAYDKYADLAILKCDTDIGIAPLNLANSDNAKQGDKVFAVGYPLGLSNTMSDGIISSRYVEANNIDVIQITAAISHGSSGGAVFNKHGNVIGVTSAYIDGGQNLNLAVSSNMVRQLYNSRSGALITLESMFG